ncbi:glycosyltransferase family 4 protein [bacterium]|nr:glycosyltransferase family 4 protein [bacterium]
MAPKLEVAFDASVLGYAQYGAAGRTGVFRVADAFARELARHPECALSFCGAENFRMWASACDYLQDEAAFRKFPRLHYNNPARVYRFLGRLFYELEGEPLISLPARAYRKSLGMALRGVERSFQPLQATALEGKHIYHSSFFALPEASRRVKGLRRYLTVCDVINLRHPEFNPSGSKYFQRVIESLTPDDWAIAISETTKQELCAYRPDLDPNRVFVVPLAASNLFQPATDRSIAFMRAHQELGERPYFLSVCTVDRRKNLEGLVKAFALWVKETGNTDTDLVLCGAHGDSTNQVREQIVSNGLERKRVKLPGYVPDVELPALYAGALAFVYVSFHEGFGLPVLEAMQCGAPVITSDSGALAEVAQGAALGVQVRDPRSIAEGLEKIRNSEVRARCAQASLARAAEFSWQRSADLLLRAYKASE